MGDLQGILQQSCNQEYLLVIIEFLNKIYNNFSLLYPHEFIIHLNVDEQQKLDQCVESSFCVF